MFLWFLRWNIILSVSWKWVLLQFWNCWNRIEFSMKFLILICKMVIVEVIFLVMQINCFNVEMNSYKIQCLQWYYEQRIWVKCKFAFFNIFAIQNDALDSWTKKMKRRNIWNECFKRFNKMKMWNCIRGSVCGIRNQHIIVFVESHETPKLVEQLSEVIC